MRMGSWLLNALCCPMALWIGGCTPTYSRADLAKEERHLDEDASSEIQYDEGLEEVGGRSEEELDEMDGEAIRESDL